jgi:hypothetical protein
MQVVEVVEVGLATPTVDLVEQVVVEQVVARVPPQETQEPQELQTLVEVVEQVLFRDQQVEQVDLEL